MISQLRRAVFLDRDGVINRTLLHDGITRPPHDLHEFELLPEVDDATARLAEAGWPIVVVTNQPDVARGRQTREAVHEINQHIVKHLPVLEVFTCYHDGHDGCECRKPKPGLLHHAARRWGFDLERSVMVGDRWSDVIAGQAAGCFSILLETPHSGSERCRPDLCVRDLGEAARWIIDSYSAKGAT